MSDYASDYAAAIINKFSPKLQKFAWAQWCGKAYAITSMRTVHGLSRNLINSNV